jgi:hypothetical protein
MERTVVEVRPYGEIQIERFASHLRRDRASVRIDECSRVAALARWPSEPELVERQHTMRRSADDPAVAVHSMVVHRTEEDQVERDGFTAMAMLVNMMGVEGCSTATARKAASLISFTQGTPLRLQR